MPALLDIVMSELAKSHTPAISSPSAMAMPMVGIFKSFLDSGKWGYVMLRSLLQNEKEELCIIESVLEYVLIKGPDHVMHSSFRLLLQMLYDVDLLSEEVLVEWAKRGVSEAEGGCEDGDREGTRSEPPEVTLETRRALMMDPQLQEFIAWLQEDEEDDSSDDDDEEEGGVESDSCSD